MTDSKPTRKNEPFIEQVLRWCGGENNRATRAELKRYWSPATRHQSWAILGRLGTLRPNHTSPETILAALYGVHPSHKMGSNRLGRAALTLAGGHIRSDHFESFDRHFRRLLACEGGQLEELGGYLHRLFKRLEREDIPVDFNTLLWDLRNWHRRADDVKSEWARQFYQAPHETEVLQAEDSR